MLAQRLILKSCVAAGLAFSLAGWTQAAHAEKFRTLYSFNGSGLDGGIPSGALVRDGAGNLYGTVVIGGADDVGAVFKLARDGTFALLHSFNGFDGRNPGGLIQDSATGELYGVTTIGGPRGCSCGVVYKLTPDGKETVLHIFKGKDGRYPQNLTMDQVGNLYGSAAGGGVDDNGVIYKLAADGSFSILHTFLGADGRSPGYMEIDELGNLYGVAGGGTGCIHESCGVVFKLAPDSTYTVLHAFTGARGGRGAGRFVRDTAGHIYGVSGGGDKPCECGLSYKLAPDGTFTVLHIFTGGSDGALPRALFRAGSGKFYGIADGVKECHGGVACGMIFRMTQDGDITVLHRFANDGQEGTYPVGLVLDKGDRDISGATSRGGANDEGTLFTIRK